MFIPTTELARPIGIPTKEAKAEIETAEDKISNKKYNQKL